MKILIVGGSGLIGGDAAMHLESLGHAVAIGGRHPVPVGSPLARFPFVPGDYIAGTFPREQLEGFDCLVFASGQDPRHVPREEDAAAFWQRANVEAIPRFFELARASGIGVAINIGSFYPWAAPHLVEKIPYVKARLDTDTALRGLSSAAFRVVTLNPPYMLGATAPAQGVRSFERMVRYAAGGFPDIPVFAPPGGVNFLSTRSLSQAIAGAIRRGEGGRAYLIGDGNLSFQEYIRRYFAFSNRDIDIPVLDRDHPLIGSMAGRGGTLYFETDERDAETLAYRRDDVSNAIRAIVRRYGPEAGGKG